MSGFKVKPSSGDALPGSVSFTPKTPSDKASKLVNSVSSKSSSGTVISYFTKHVQTEIRDMLRNGCPEHAVSLRGYTAFVVKGYTKGVGSVVIRVDTGTSTSSSYKYVGVLGLIYKDGSVDWYVLKATLYSSGTFSMTLGSSLCAAISQDGRSAVLFILGESYRWW